MPSFGFAPTVGGFKYEPAARRPVFARLLSSEDDCRCEPTFEAEQAMRDFLAANPKDKHGAHRYSLEQFGLDAEEQAGRFAGYRARFGC